MRRMNGQAFLDSLNAIARLVFAGRSLVACSAIGLVGWQDSPAPIGPVH